METQKTTIHLPAKNTNSSFSHVSDVHLPVQSHLPGSHVAVHSTFPRPQAALRVPDYDLGKRWYMEKLDFQLMHEWPLGPLQLGFLGSPQIASEIVLIAGAHHCSMDVESVDKAIRELQRRKVKIMGEPCDIPLIGKRLVFFSDPWGNLIELSEQLK